MTSQEGRPVPPSQSLIHRNLITARTESHQLHYNYERTHSRRRSAARAARKLCQRCPFAARRSTPPDHCLRTAASALWIACRSAVRAAQSAGHFEAPGVHSQPKQRTFRVEIMTRAHARAEHRETQLSEEEIKGCKCFRNNLSATNFSALAPAGNFQKTIKLRTGLISLRLFATR